jgi:hypothetical protein
MDAFWQSYDDSFLEAVLLLMVIAANQYHRVYYIKTPQNPTAISREAYTHNILFGNTHHLHDLLYMPQHTFSSLSDWLLNNTSVRGCRPPYLVRAR